MTANNVSYQLNYNDFKAYKSDNEKFESLYKNKANIKSNLKSSHIPNKAPSSLSTSTKHHNSSNKYGKNNRSKIADASNYDIDDANADDATK